MYDRRSVSDTVFPSFRHCNLHRLDFLWFEKFKGLTERPLKGPSGLYRGFMRLYKGGYL